MANIKKPPINTTEPIFAPYAESINPEILKKVDMTTAFNTYMTGRSNAQTLLAATHLPGEDAKASGFDKRLEDAVKTDSTLQNAVNTFKKDLDLILQGSTHSDQLNQAQSTFNQAIQTLMADAKKSPPPTHFRLHDIPQYINLLQTEALNTIKAVQKKEREALHQKTITLQVPGISDLKASLEKTLDNKHQQEIEAFQKACHEAEKEIKSKLFTERQRIALLDKLYHMNKKYAKDIDALSKQHSPSTTVQQASSFSARYRGIQPSMLNELTTVTGNGINKSGEMLSITIPGDSIWRNLKHIFGMLTNSSVSVDADRADLTMLAATMMANGVEHITMTVQCDDPTKAMELAKKAYEGCILAGYPPEKITIKSPIGENQKMEIVSGQVKKGEFLDPADKLFTSDPMQLSLLHKQGEQVRHEINLSVQMSSSQELIKKYMEDLKKKPADDVTMAIMPTSASEVEDVTINLPSSNHTPSHG